MARRNDDFHWSDIPPAGKLLVVLAAPVLAAYVWWPPHGLYITTVAEALAIGGAFWLYARRRESWTEAFSDLLNLYLGWKSDWEKQQATAGARARRAPPLPSQARTNLKIAVGLQCEIPNCRQETHLNVHHIRPRSQGGGNGIRNLLVVCRNHHAACDQGSISRMDQLALARRQRRFRSADVVRSWKYGDRDGASAA